MRTRVFYVDPEQFLAALDRSYEPLARHYRYVATIDADSAEDAFAKMNRGSGKEIPELDGRRSMSVGDIVYLGDLYYLCQATGWKLLEPGPQMSALYVMAVQAEVREKVV